jgi:hypothetical protein
MTSNGTPPGPPAPTAAADVSFQRLAEPHGESSSQASSSRSAGRRSGEGRRSKEDKRWSPVNPDRGSANGPSKDVGAKRNRTSGGFLLDTTLMNGSPKGSDLPHRNGKRKAQNGSLRVHRRRDDAARFSGESSVGGSPLSREVSREQERYAGFTSPTAPRASSMDPAQLVQMALELSESRRRQVSGGLQLPLPSPRDSRRVSGLQTLDASRLSTPPRQRTSYASNDRSPGTPSPYRSSINDEQLRIRDFGGDGAQADDVPRHFSPATLSRAERARKYFELASEHRRLLQSLPPLKPDADAPGNHAFTSTNSPGSALPQITRVPSYADKKHDLGRPYNPLQALRNRKLRNRERQPLPAPTESWNDTERIRQWVDDVEAATEQVEYRHAPDRVQLPTYSGDDGGASDSREVGKGHKRNDTVGSIITRPENGWHIEPCELLADTYWTEKDDNKAMIETRHGTLVFPATPGIDDDKPRHSKDTARKSAEQQKADAKAEEVPFHKRAHRGPHLIPRRHKVLPRSGSVSSATSEDGRMIPIFANNDDDYENTAPLEKQMQKLIAKDAKGEPMSPDATSPDHWQSQHTPFPVIRASGGRSRGNTASQEYDKSNTDKGRLSVDAARQHTRAKSADGRFGGSVGRRSLEDSLDNVPRSPAVEGFRTSLDIERSSPESSGAVGRHRSRLHRLPFIRARSKDRNGTDVTDFASSRDKFSFADDGNAIEPRSSRESDRPSFVHRNMTNDSYASSLRRQATNTTASGSGKESMVGRLFKGGRVGELVRNESSRFSDRFKSKDRQDDLQTQPEHPEGDLETPLDDVDDEPSPRTSLDVPGRKPKYNLPNLPTFKSPAARSAGLTPSSIDSDPIARQQRAQRETSKPSRFNQLPRINLPGEEEYPDLERPGVETNKRKSYGFLVATSQGTSRTSLSSGNNPNRSSTALARLQQEGGRRHWSISDLPHSHQGSDQVTTRDVARVRALLLSSGIKAREIQRQAESSEMHSPAMHPFPLYREIEQTVKSDAITTTPRIDKAVVAARLLASYLDMQLSNIENAISMFQTGPASKLNDRIDVLGRKAADQLTTTVHDTSDDADAFIVELTTKMPQDVKRVDDAVDEILRRRRRRWRIVRKVGFKVLEWAVLVVLWWVWFVVVLINAGRRVAYAVLSLVRWLIWF